MKCLRNSRSLLRCKLRPAAVRSPPTRYYNHTSTATERRPWYRDPWKIASAAALVSAATAAAVHGSRRYLEIVPYTNRTHLVVISPKAEREFWTSRFTEDKKKWASDSLIVDPHHPDSVRVRLIAEKIISAAHRTLISSQKQVKGPQPPQTSHLDGLEWEVILLKDRDLNALCAAGGKIAVNTGVLDHLKTDGEIAMIIAHEVGHIIARHKAELVNHKWFPIPLWLPFFAMNELEADRIGMLLLAAAGFHPYTAHVVLYKQAMMDSGETVLDSFLNPYPSFKKRLQRLSEAKVMEEALELYREAIAGQAGTEQDSSFRESAGEACNIILTRLNQVLTGRHNTHKTKQIARTQPAMVYEPCANHKVNYCIQL